MSQQFATGWVERWQPKSSRRIMLLRIFKYAWCLLMFIVPPFCVYKVPLQCSLSCCSLTLTLKRSFCLFVGLVWIGLVWFVCFVCLLVCLFCVFVGLFVLCVCWFVCFVCLLVCLFVCLLVGWLVGWLGLVWFGLFCFVLFCFVGWFDCVWFGFLCLFVCFVVFCFLFAKALEEDWKKTKGAGCVDFVTKNFSTVAQVEGMLANMKEWSGA